jgi:hypothetical protein
MKTSELQHPTSQVRVRPVMREAKFSDYENIAALQTRNGLTTKSRDDWMALWRENPEYNRAACRWAIGLVLETPHGEIVGFIGSIPVGYHFRCRHIRAAVTTSWVTDPQYRGYSIGLLNAVERQSDIDLLLTNTASAKAEACLRCLRWSRVPVAGWDNSYGWITNYTGFARSLLSKSSIPIAGALAYPMGAAIYCSEKFRKSLDQARHSNLAVELCPEVDSRFEEFWNQLALFKSDSLLGIRDRSTLEWHFNNQLRRGSAWIVTICKGREMVAYAAFDRVDNPKFGLRRVRLVDFQAVEHAREALAATLAWMLRKCCAEGVHLLETSAALLRALGDAATVAPYERKLHVWRYYYKTLNPELSDALGDPDVWCTSDYDGDASL